jgi:hypothetical protein
MRGRWKMPWMMLVCVALGACSGPPDTPTAGFLELAHSLAAGEERAVFARVAVTDKTLMRSAQATYARQLGETRWQHAVRAVFGESVLSPYDVISMGIETGALDSQIMQRWAVTVSGNTATVRSFGSTEYWVLKDGMWKLDFDKTHGRMPEDEAIKALADGEAYTSLAADVRAGKFKKYEEALKDARLVRLKTVPGTQMGP